MPSRTPPADDDPQAVSGGGVAAIVVLVPVFNDWESLGLLLPRLDDALGGAGLRADVLVVDDGSTMEPDSGTVAGPYRAIERVDRLALRRNLGHQRAIAIGLSFVEDRLGHEVVVVMDGDGEDDPSDVPRLLARLKREPGEPIVFAERARRTESRTFRVYYQLYKLLHLAMTGQRVRVGNFSAVPRRRLRSLVVVSELWNHYAAAAFRSRQPCVLVPSHRGRRLSGRSRMNFVNLVAHGLSAIATYSDVVGVRLLVLAAVLTALGLGGLGALASLRLFTDVTIPDWAAFGAGVLLLLVAQAIMLAFLFSFTILGARQGSTFLPRRDYPYFIGAFTPLGRPERDAPNGP